MRAIVRARSRMAGWRVVGPADVGGGACGHRVRRHPWPDGARSAGPAGPAHPHCHRTGRGLCRHDRCRGRYLHLHAHRARAPDAHVHLCDGDGDAVGAVPGGEVLRAGPRLPGQLHRAFSVRSITTAPGQASPSVTLFARLPSWLESWLELPDVVVHAVVWSFSAWSGRLCSGSCSSAAPLTFPWGRVVARRVPHRGRCTRCPRGGPGGDELLAEGRDQLLGAKVEARDEMCTWVEFSDELLARSAVTPTSSRSPSVPGARDTRPGTGLGCVTNSPRPALGGCCPVGRGRPTSSDQCEASWSVAGHQLRRFVWPGLPRRSAATPPGCRAAPPSAGDPPRVPARSARATQSDSGLPTRSRLPSGSVMTNSRIP